jgi:hypothetical protein
MQPPWHAVSTARQLRATSAAGTGYIGRHVAAPDPNTPVRVGILLPPRRSPWRTVLPLAAIVALLAVSAWALNPPAEPVARVVSRDSIHSRVDLNPRSVILCAGDGGGAVVAGSLNPSDYNGSSSCRGSDRQ